MADEAAAIPIRRTRHGRKGMIALLLILFAIISISVFLWRLAPRRQPLLARAHRVMPLTATAVSPNNSSVPSPPALVEIPYVWESEKTLLQARYYVMPEIAGRVERVEEATGSTAIVPALSNKDNPRLQNVGFEGRIQGGQNMTFFSPMTALLCSPDSRWMLWYDSTTSMNSNPLQSTLAIQDASTIAGSWQMPDNALRKSPLWLPDSRHWMYFAADTVRGGSAQSLILNDVENADPARKIDLSETPLPYALGFSGAKRLLTADYGNVPPYTVLPLHRHVGRQVEDTPPTHWTSNGISVEDIGNRVARFVTYDIATGRADGHFSLNAPGGPDVKAVRELQLSPQGDRLAWLELVSHNAHTTAFVKMLMRWFGDRERLQTVLWTTKLDGSEPHEIGYIDTVPFEPPITDLRWVPDGRQLSFRYKDTLYTVSAQ